MGHPMQYRDLACHRFSHSGNFRRSSKPCATMFPAARATSISTSTSSSKLSKLQQPAYKWFGYYSQTSSFEVDKACIIQVAAYDLESGQSYTALVNPGHHQPKYVWGRNAYKEHGISQSVLKAEGIPLTEAFAGLVDFISTHTPAGHTAALVAHRGFTHHFPVMQLELLEALGPQTQNNHSARTVPCNGQNSSDMQKIRQQQHVGWPTDWLFHDSHLIASCLLRMEPQDSLLRPYVRDLSEMGLARSLFLQSHRVDDVLPLERAYVNAADAARITPILLQLLHSFPQPPAVDGRQQVGKGHPADWQHAADLYDINRQWLDRPWALEYSDNFKAHVLRRRSALRDLEGRRRGLRAAKLDPVAMCPPQMVQAVVEAHDRACAQTVSLYHSVFYDAVMSIDPE